MCKILQRGDHHKFLTIFSDLNERVIYDSTRPQRVIRDFEVAVPVEAQPVHKSYKIAPGTLHVFSQRGVLAYNTSDIGAARMASPEKK